LKEKNKKWGKSIEQYFRNSKNSISVIGEIVDLFPLFSLHCSMSLFKSGRMSWAGHVERMGEKRNAYRILVGKPEG
jgi:hypothetical protein